MAYYVSTDSYTARYQQWRKSADEVGRPIRSKQVADHFILDIRPLNYSFLLVTATNIIILRAKSPLYISARLLRK
jgi:hypothetical protein